MDSKKAEPNPTPPETNSAQANEPVETSKPENGIDKDPSYLRSRQIALKKFTPQEGRTEA
jgi:hypothetical protein